MTKKSHISVLFTLEVALRFGMCVILLQAESVAAGLLRKVPPTGEFYFFSLGIAFAFAILVRLGGPSRLVADIQELCLYDVVVQGIGMALFYTGSQATSATVVAASNAVLLAKGMRLFWPVTVLQDQDVRGWPPFGLLGLLGRVAWVAPSEPKWHQRRLVIYGGLLATIPLGYGVYRLSTATKWAPISYTLLAISLFGLQPLMRRLKQLDADRTAAIERELATQAKLVAMEQDRASHFKTLADERAAMAASLKLSNERILHANHDIMQPVFWLDSALQQAGKHAADPALRELLDKALLASHEISDMLGDVFHQVTLEANGQGPQQQVLAVAAVGQYFWDRFYDAANRHGVRLVMGNERFAILGNEARLRRVIANLLNNAILYSGPGALVSLRFCRRFGACHVFVRNSGVGITDANSTDRAANTTRLLARIAQAHTQDAMRAAQVPLIGHGFGLHSAARICGELNTPLLLRSRPGFGSVFCVRVPLAPA